MTLHLGSVILYHEEAVTEMSIFQTDSYYRESAV